MPAIPAWLLVLLQQFILPKAQRFFENYFEKNGKLPTLEELQAELTSETNAGIIKGITWLETHGND